MKIVINTIPLLSPLTGVGNYIYQISKTLQNIDSINDYTYFYGYYSKKLFTYRENKERFYKAKELIKKIPFVRDVARKSKGIINIFWHRKFDLYFEPNFIPINIRAKKIVVTVLDFSFEIHPEWHPKDKVLFFKKYFWENIKKTDRIILNSEYIKESAINLFSLSEDKIRTIPLGYNNNIFRTYSKQNLRAIKDKYNLPESFMLFAGSIEPRKNLKSLIHAYMHLDKGIQKDFKLVLVGFKGWENNDIMELLNKLKSDITYIGYVPDEDLGKLYGLATLFVYPSLYEGFGLPPLEAMACGCPVVVSNVASLPEVCGDAAYYVDPYNVESIAEGMQKVLTDDTLRQSLIQKGIERAKLFSWEKSAKEHIKVFEEVLKS